MHLCEPLTVKEERTGENRRVRKVFRWRVGRTSDEADDPSSLASRDEKLFGDRFSRTVASLTAAVGIIALAVGPMLGPDRISALFLGVIDHTFDDILR
jgi:hypothetical protein